MLILICTFLTTMNADVYVEDILISYVVPYAPFIGENFLLMQAPTLQEECLISLMKLVYRLDWPANSPD